MKLNINLQPIINIGSGIATFANELTAYLAEQNIFQINGIFNFVRHISPKDLPQFTFPIHYSYIPYKLIYSRLIKTELPINYSCIAGQSADINIFFTYRIPRVKYSGITISTIHDVIPLKVKMESESISKQYGKEIQYAAKHSDYLITVSENSKKDIVNFLDYDPNRIVVIPNGVNLRAFDIEISDIIKQRIREKYKLPKHFILYMGSMRKHKNVCNLIKAYALLDNKLKSKYHLVITKGTTELHNLAKALNIDKFVTFTSFIDEADKICVYKMAEIFAFVSLYEGFGIPVIEAQAAGIPVVTSSNSSLIEIGKDSTILVDPCNTASIKEGLNRLLLDETLRKKIILKGYNNAQKYSWTCSGEKLREFLQSIMK